MNQILSGGRMLAGPGTHADKQSIDAVCLNCNKHLKSIRAVSMHLGMTGTRQTVNFISYGNYDTIAAVAAIDGLRFSLTGTMAVIFRLWQAALVLYNIRADIKNV